MNDDFNTIDAVTAEKFVEETSRSLIGVIRFFKDRGLMPIHDIAFQIKKEIDEFKPKVPRT